MYKWIIITFSTHHYHDFFNTYTFHILEIFDFMYFIYTAFCAIYMYNIFMYSYMLLIIIITFSIHYYLKLIFGQIITRCRTDGVRTHKQTHIFVL